MLEKTKLMKLKDKVQLLETDHPDILDENNEFPSGTDLTLNGTGDLKMKVDVAGNSTQIQYEGYNLADNIITNQTINGLQVTVNEDKTVLVNGTASADTVLNVYRFQPEANSSYSITGCPSGGNYNSYMLIFNVYGTTDIGNGATVNTTADPSVTNFNIKIFSGTVCNNLLFKPMIVEGTDLTKPYEPYVGGTASPNPTYKQDINNVEGNVVVKGSSKNLLNINNIPNTTYQTVSNDTLIISGENYSSTRKKLSELAPSLQIGKTYCLNFESTAQDHNTVIYLSGENNTWTKNTPKTITQVMLDSIVVFYGGDTMSAIISNIQLEEGTTATPYVPHAENTVTFPLSQGQKLMLGDTLEDDGIHHKRGKIVLDGTENWVDYTTQIEGYYKAYCTTKKTTALFGILTGLCTHFKIADVSLTATQAKNLLGSNQYALYISISNNVASNVTELKTYLAEQYANGTPVIVEYELAQETTEAYTSAQQTAYNKLKEMQSYYDLTYVVGSSDNAQPILTAKAKKSLKVMNDEISNLNSRLTLLEE